MNSDKDNIRRYWVAPFGDSRIKSCSHFPGTFRRVLRPSSPLIAKASTRCPFHSWFSMRMWNLKTSHTYHRSFACRWYSKFCFFELFMSSQYPHKNIYCYTLITNTFIKTLYTDYSSIYSLHFLFTLSNNTLDYFTKDGWSFMTAVSV